MFGMQPSRPGNSLGAHKFSQIPSVNMQRSAFDRSHGLKTTFDAGFLVPILIDEALPGDSFSLSANTFARLSTPLHPIMDNLYMDTFYFAVPYRLVWDNFQKFCGEQIDPGDSTDFLIPQMPSPVGGWQVTSMGDYFALPLAVDITTSALFFRAYNLIWNEFFRDENLQTSETVDRDDGPDDPADYTDLQKRGKRHDYLTSALPWPQKGPAVELPLGTTAPVISAGDGLPLFVAEAKFGKTLVADETGGKHVTYSGTETTSSAAMAWDETKLQTDLSSATAATINAIRLAFQIQKLYERDARGGTRYREILLSHFNVSSPDARLQRPEYLGGNTGRLEQAVVPQTGEAGSTPQGHLGSYGTVETKGGGFTKSFTEHTLLIGLVSVRADIHYQQGINRMHSRLTRWDHYWPALSSIGEQAVLNQEIYAQGTGADTNVFGYQERWAEYRYKASEITGFLRSTAPTSLDTWHVAQEFASLPLLNATFISEDPAIARTQAVPSEVQFIFDAWFNYTCVRPMPTYSVPGLIDHF